MKVAEVRAVPSPRSARGGARDAAWYPSNMNRAAALLLLTGLGCGEQKPADAPKAGDDDAREVTFVNAVVLVDHCAEAKNVDVKAANAAIRRLVAPCGKVPGGAAHFSVALRPGGEISIGAPGGGPAEGVFPTCALQAGLRHRVSLQKECKFDVQLEERKVSSP